MVPEGTREDGPSPVYRSNKMVPEGTREDGPSPVYRSNKMAPKLHQSADLVTCKICSLTFCIRFRIDTLSKYR